MDDGPRLLLLHGTRSVCLCYNRRRRARAQMAIWKGKDDRFTAQSHSNKRIRG